MPPVLSPLLPRLTTRRRLVPPSAAMLFPASPEIASFGDCGKPQTLPASALTVVNLASRPGISGLQVPVSPGGSAPGCPPADCPPPVSAKHRSTDDAHCGTQAAAAPLVGIARLAASSPPAHTQRCSAERPEYFLLPVRSILNRCDSNRVPFEWTINPYRGCEFACKYCYARYTHEYMELDGADFERKIFVKQDAAPLLARDIAHKYSYESKASDFQEPEHIAIGTATDPYQPAEREYGVTRACLKELAKREGISVSITTKSNQVVRDIDVLKEIAAKSALYLNITITTLMPRLARLLEPRAPRPDLRMAAVRELRAAGLNAGVFASPLLPGITDREGDIEALAQAAKEAGAQWFSSGVLFLMPSSAKQFLPFVREKFPRLAKQYEQWYARDAYAPEEYRRAISARVAKIRQAHGFAARPWDEKKRTVPKAQLSLAWDRATAEMQVERGHSCAAG
jgi:DNA repair photolyase